MSSPPFNNLRTIILLLYFLSQLVSCASYGTISNLPVADVGPSVRYSVGHALHSGRSDEVTLVLAFSGGGTRAAALSYGVLAALRDATVNLDGQPRRLLDEVDAISAVSGGSFTAACFGLYGDGVFADFENTFLRNDVAGELVSGLLDPALWFSEGGRTEMAVEYFEEKVFRGATFADLQQRGGPLVVINATDLGRGVRFSFIQDYFDLLCSDLSSFPVARAVAASSAVPVLFHPVVLENHADCNVEGYTFMDSAGPQPAVSPQLKHVVEGLRSYALKDQRRYIHLVDGGITDNLGLLAIYEMVEVSGGAKLFLENLGSTTAQRFVVVSVNASTTPNYDIEQTNAVPSLESTINLVTDVQVHRSNAATLELMNNSMRRWSDELTTPGLEVEPYFIEIDFRGIADQERREYFNQIPTSLTLTDAQVDDLIAAGRELLENNAEFRRFVRDIESD